MLRLLSSLACPRRALRWGHMQPLTKGHWTPAFPVMYAVPWKGNVVMTLRPSPPWPLAWRTMPKRYRIVSATSAVTILSDD
jgi:hypothetical protein